jgi:proteasome lid subunit RPN8/RPN11
MLDITEKDFRQHAEQEYPNESCGLIIIFKGREKYFPCRNVATNPTETFTMSIEDYADAEEQGEIVACCHSHPNAVPTPSQADIVSCEASKLVWHIVRVDGEAGIQADGEIGQIGRSLNIHTFEPTGYKAPLVGRTFSHGVLDCYSLVKDWYKEERGIDLPPFKRADGWWDDGTSNLYMDHMEEAGFYDVGQFQPNGKMTQPEIGDMILMQIRSKNGVPNHAGIYIGDGMMLHHLYGRLSSRDMYGGYYQEVTRTFFRYKNK